MPTITFIWVFVAVFFGFLTGLCVRTTTALWVLRIFAKINIQESLKTEVDALINQHSELNRRQSVEMTAKEREKYKPDAAKARLYSSTQYMREMSAAAERRGGQPKRG